MRVCLFLVLWVSIALNANPSGATVVSGAALFTNEENSLVIGTTSDRTIIEWDSFSIAQGERTLFDQPSITSAVLNRVTSANMSDLVGKLDSNGEVFLINPNGILIQNGALVDVSSLIASTLDVLDAEFLANGSMTFSGSSTATVENAGLILGDKGVFILGRHIINSGDILGARGVVGLGAADSVLLLADQAGIMINVTAGTPTGTGVIHSGGIVANQASIQANGNLYALAIHHPGWTSAHTTTANDGEIVLRADAGETLLDGIGQLYVEGPNGVGGLIAIEGQTVTLNDQVDINASDIFGGGTIYIGGSAGADPSILEADNTTISEGVRINADAFLDGNGGNVVVYANQTADFAGSISAIGGSGGGNGGVVEVSGIGNLIFTGQVTTTAINGETGLLIIDPTDITISNGATAGGAFNGGSPTNTFLGSAAAATLNITDLNAALSTNNVVVTTTSGFAGAGNITWSTATAVTSTASNNLTLLADNDITFTTTFTMTDTALGTAELTLAASNDITLSTAFTATNLAEVNIDAGNDVLLDNAINASGATLTITAANDIVSQGGADNTILTDVCIFNAINNITLTNELNSTGDSSSTSTLNWTAGNQISIDNDCDFNNWNTATLNTTSGDIIIDNAVIANVVGTLTLNSGRDLINQGGTNLLNDAAGNVTDLRLLAVRDFLITSQIDINNFNSAFIDVGRDVLISQDFEPDNTTVVTVQAGNDITTSGAGNIIAANATNLNFIASNDFNNATPFTVTNVDNVLMSAGNDVNITGTVNVTGADTVVISTNDTNILTTFTSLGLGDISVTTGNDLNVGPSTALSQLGTRLGDIELLIGRDLNVIGGNTSGDRSQIGFNASVVDSNIELTVGRNVNLTAGNNSSSVVQIGHGFSVAGVYSGDIIIHEVAGNVNLTAGPAGPGSVKFAQIGFTRNSSSGTSTFSGDIRGTSVGLPALIRGALNLLGGGDSTSYALFGHGGRSSNALETYSGEVRVQANSMTLLGGTATDSNASIGYFATAQGGGTNFVTINNAEVEAISQNAITMTAQTDGVVSIGARVLNTASHPSILDVDLVTIETGGNLEMTSGTVDIETDATIGAFTEFGVASTAITMDIGGDLLMTAQTVSPAQIINGVATTALKDVLIDVGGNITPAVTGGFPGFIQATTGDLTIRADGNITMPDSLTFIQNFGGSNGTILVQAANIFLLNGGFSTNLGTGTSRYRTVSGSGDLVLVDGGFIASIGSIFGTIARDVSLLDDATITSSMGLVRFLVGRDIDIIGGAGGSSFITSFLSGFYQAGRDITLSGISALNEGSITNTSGTLDVFAGVDVSVDFFGRIENLGAGALTIVVDNLFPDPPERGPGAFNLSSLGTVGRLDAGPLRIFTSVRSQNSVEGTGNLNGETFVPGPLFVDSATERWATYYPSSFGGNPFTIFYKDAEPPSVTDIVLADPNAFVAFSQLFYILDNRPMDPILAWLYETCIENNLCIPKQLHVEPTLRGDYCIQTLRRLPPYLRKLDLKPFH